jgi:sulfane dehydrogenase subunit SoxC
MGSVFSRRGFLEGVSVGIAGSMTGGPAGAETLADVRPREPGVDLSADSERSKFVKPDRIPEATPGKRDVDPADAINLKTPHQKLVGSITPSACITSAAIPVCPTSSHFERG